MNRLVDVNWWRHRVIQLGIVLLALALIRLWAESGEPEIALVIGNEPGSLLSGFGPAPPPSPLPRIPHQFPLNKIQKTLNPQRQLRVAVVHRVDRLAVAAVGLGQQWDKAAGLDVGGGHEV